MIPIGMQANHDEMTFISHIPYAAKYYSLMKLSDEIDHHHVLHFEVYEFVS